MTQFFIQLLNASIASSWLIGAVLLVRLVIKGRSPRWIACLLWGLVALRLVVPFSVESPLSLVPETPEITLDFSEEAPSETESIPAPPVSEMGNTSRPEEESYETEESEPSVPSEDSFAEPSEEPSSEPSEEPSFEPSYSEEPSEEPSSEPSEEPSEEPSSEPSEEPSEEPDVSEESYEEISEEESQETSRESSEESSEESEESEEESTHESSEESIPAGMMGSTSTPGNPSHGSGISFATTASGIWLAGVLALAGYALVNYLILKKRVLVFVPDERGFRRCEGIDTPFVLGFFRPRIYLPYGLSTASEPYIIAHEKAHIKRMDHLVKPIAYCILALHWFNPLVWLAFVLFCKDIEYACDEKVLKNAAADIRKEYATALLECASKRSFLAACPIAFGEVSVKERVKKTMNYKRPLLLVIIVSVLLCALVAVLFFTAPMDEESAPNTPSEEQTSSEASTELSTEESSVTEPSEPEVSEPEVSEPEESEPEVSEPEVSEPEVSEPEISEPDESEPEVSEPEVSEPEVSEPEVSESPEEPVIPPTLELPPEEELKAELQLRFDIGPGHTVQYGGEYYEFPEYATPMLYYGIVADGKGNFYLEKSKTLIRINDSKEFPYQFSESFAQVIFLEDDLYVHTVDGYVRRFDISAGFENGTLCDEWKKYERFNGDGSIRLVDGHILFRDDQGQYSTLDGEAVEQKEPYTFVSSAEQVVTKLEDGTFAVHNGYDNWDYYIRCIDGEGLIIVNYEADVFWTDTHSVLQTEYLLFNRNGELYSRLMLRSEAGYQYQPCKIECGTCTIEYYHPKTLYFNGMVFEDVIYDTVLYGEDGTFYLMVLHPHYGEIYAITGGVTHEEFLSSEGWTDDIDDLPILVSIDMMKRDALLEFLADPRTYSFRGGWDIPVNGIPGYPTLNYERFYLKPDLLEIATDHSAMEAFLKKRGITCDVTEIHLFEAAITPFTLFVKTGDGTLYFIGVEYSEDVYTYTLYTEEEYLAAYYPYPLTIMVDGKKLETDDPFVTYGGYAELPLVAIMEALGAKLEWKYDDYVGITWGGNQCWIDTDYSSLTYGGQRFHAVMDRYSLYKGNDVTFRSDVLQEFFKAFCHGVTVRVDAEESVVYIDNQYADTVECYFSPDGKSVLYAVWNEDEAYDWYRIVGDGEPEALPIEIQPYRDSMKRWANDFSVVYFTDINQSTFLSCLYKWDENGEVSLLSETCDADTLSVLYEDGSLYFQEISHVTYDTFIENDLGKAGEEPMAWVSRMRARMATVYYYDGNEKKLAAENVWWDATGWDPYAAEASGGAYLTLDLGEKFKLSAILEIVGENRNKGWLDEAMRAFAKCIYTVKDQYYTVDLDRASVAIIAKDAKHLAVLSDWDPRTNYGTLYLVKIGEQGVLEITQIYDKTVSKEPMRMNAYFTGSGNYLEYYVDDEGRVKYVEIGDQS